MPVWTEEDSLAIYTHAIRSTWTGARIVKMAPRYPIYGQGMVRPTSQPQAVHPRKGATRD